MEQVLNIKDIEVRKKIKNSAFRNAIIGSIITSLFSLLSINSFLVILIKGLIFGSLAFAFIFFKWNRVWNKLKRRYLSPKYAKLKDIGLIFNEQLFFSGIYKDYFINVIPIEQDSEKGQNLYFDVIQIFYQPNERTNEYIEAPFVVKYYIGDLYFFDKCVVKTYINVADIDFKKDLDYMVNILKREDYKAIYADNLNEIKKN